MRFIPLSWTGHFVFFNFSILLEIRGVLGGCSFPLCILPVDFVALCSIWKKWDKEISSDSWRSEFVVHLLSMLLLQTSVSTTWAEVGDLFLARVKFDFPSFSAGFLVSDLSRFFSWYVSVGTPLHFIGKALRWSLSPPWLDIHIKQHISKGTTMKIYIIYNTVRVLAYLQSRAFCLDHFLNNNLAFWWFVLWLIILFFGYFLPFQPVSLLFLWGHLGKSAQLMTDNFQLRNQSKNSKKIQENRPFTEWVSYTYPFLQICQLCGHFLWCTFYLWTAFAARAGGQHSNGLSFSLVRTRMREKATFLGNLHISSLKNFLWTEIVTVSPLQHWKDHIFLQYLTSMETHNSGQISFMQYSLLRLNIHSVRDSCCNWFASI